MLLLASALPPATAPPAARAPPVLQVGAVTFRPPAQWTRRQRSRRTVFFVRPDLPYSGLQADGQSWLHIGAAGKLPSSLEANLKAYARDGVVTATRVLDVRSPASPCHSLTEQVVSEDPVAPEGVAGRLPKLRYTQVFCRADDDVYVGVLSVWEGARHRARDRRALLAVMQGLRPAAPASPAEPTRADPPPKPPHP